MLKITVIDNSVSRRLVLEGALWASWVPELEIAWKMAKLDLRGRKLVVDMTDITSISQEGEAMLVQLMREGAQLRSHGLFTKHVIRQLRRRSKGDVKLCEPPNAARDET